VADRAPESFWVVPFDQYRGEPQTRDFQASNQASGSDGGRARRLDPGAVIPQQTLEIATFALLKNPGVRDDETAIAQEQSGACET
jgi:hypothetical protein